MAVIHYFLSPLLVAHGFVPLLLSNVLFMVAVSYYHYLNYLGYDGELGLEHYLVSHFFTGNNFFPAVYEFPITISMHSPKKKFRGHRTCSSQSYTHLCFIVQCYPSWREPLYSCIQLVLSSFFLPYVSSPYNILPALALFSL